MNCVHGTNFVVIKSDSQPSCPRYLVRFSLSHLVFFICGKPREELVVKQALNAPKPLAITLAYVLSG